MARYGGKFGGTGLKKKRKPQLPVRRRGGGGGAKSPIYGLGPLNPKQMKKASGALTRLELLPALRGYARQQEAIERNRQGAEAGLYGLGERTRGAVAGAYGAYGGAAQQNIARQQALAEQLNQRQAQIGQQGQADLQGMQTGQLGGIVESLKARNVDPGGSASQAALAQQAQSQQQTAAQNAQAQASFAQAQGASLQGLAGGMATAGQMRGAESQTEIANLIANRVAESNMAHREAWLEALGKRKDTKALWGPTKLKNLLELRGGEREFALASNPPTKKNVNVYKGLGKGKTAKAQIKVAKLQKEKQQIESAGLGKYGKAVGGGGGGGKKKKRRR